VKPQLPSLQEGDASATLVLQTVLQFPQWFGSLLMLVSQPSDGVEVKSPLQSA
jgi:hypothetical protein